jgi:putative transposase
VREKATRRGVLMVDARGIRGNYGMPRPPRYSLAGQPHHVIQRGNNRDLMFRADDDFRFFFATLRSATLRYNCQVHAYVFMTNHVHLLMSPVSATAMGMAMRSLGTRYVRYFNHKYARTGTLFEGRYRSSLVDTEKYLLTCYRYIEENPLRAGMARDLSTYRWSSYRANALGAEDSLVTPHDLFVALGATLEDRRSAYRALFRKDIDPDAFVAIRYAANSGDQLVGTRNGLALNCMPRCGSIPAALRGL